PIGCHKLRIALVKNILTMTFLKKNLFRSLVVFTLIIASDDNSFATHATASPVIVGSSEKTDIYVAGYSNNDQYNYIPKYWKNGKEVSLAPSYKKATASGIAVVGNDIYVAGQQRGKFSFMVKYWKNGKEINLSDEAGKGACSRAIVVEGNDVYVTGAEKV